MELRKVEHGYEISHPITHYQYWISDDKQKELFEKVGVEGFYLRSLELFIQNGFLHFVKKGDRWYFQLFEDMIPSKCSFEKEWYPFSSQINEKLFILERKYEHIRMYHTKTIHEYMYSFLRTNAQIKEELIIYAIKTISNYDHIYVYHEYK